jgi:hypothetical protein
LDFGHGSHGFWRALLLDCWDFATSVNGYMVLTEVENPSG